MSSDAPVLVADIGGTHLRVAMADLRPARPALTHLRPLSASDGASLQDALAEYLRRLPIRPRQATLAVAGPVDGEWIHLTNRGWSLRRDALQRALGLERLQVINDFGALAHAAPLLQATDLAVLQGAYRTPLRGPVSLLGPGTGLGVALALASADGRWQVVETEGGHAGFAATDDIEQAIARRLAAEHGRVSTERVLCGRGLSIIDAVLRDGEPRTPAAIVDAVLARGEAAATRALQRYCAILGSVAGDVALMHGARTVLLAGGIVPRFVPFLRASAFGERLRAKGRFADWMQQVDVHIVTHPQPGLLGAAIAARDLDAGAAD